MAKADLHVHSRFSDHPSEWFLQRIGARESYTEPEDIYRRAKGKGMKFVTLTDHNCIDGALMLKERHPDDFIIGVETTTYFPEDSCKIHVLMYGIDAVLFTGIQECRRNIHELRDFIRTHDIAYSVAHATYSINDRLTPDHLEKLIVLFDVFEGINGSRTRLNNQPWSTLLKRLTPGVMERLADKHGIEPISDTPWVKGFTGGSDDHSGMFVARAYTHTEAQTADEFIANLKNKRSRADGRYSDYQALAFTIYKIAYDFSKSKSSRLSTSLVTHLNEALFKDGPRKITDTFKVKTYRRFKSRGNGTSAFQDYYWDLYDTLSDNSATSIEDKLDICYDKLGNISDEFFRVLFTSVEEDFHRGDIVNFFRNLSSSLPGIFLAIPFFSTLRHLFLGKDTVNELLERPEFKQDTPAKKILWFTDTLSDMNGVSKTIRKIGWLSYLREKELHIVTSVSHGNGREPFPPNVVSLPSMFDFSLPYYEHYTLSVPSLLRSVKKLYTYEPDEIYISTPGPMGLFGLLMAKLMNAKAIGVYHTDFSMQARHLVEDDSVEGLVESYLTWFYSLCDEIRVPTGNYIDLLEDRGYNGGKMKLFKRGIDSVQFSPRPSGKEFLRSAFGVKEGFTLLYAGRISEDKSISRLFDIFFELKNEHGDINLVVAGDGPDLRELRTRYGSDPNVVFTGELDHTVLPEVYSGADLFVFPSTTDTFGMVVLEALSCGLPAVVSDIGGPQELIVEGVTGRIAPSGDRGAWIAAITSFITVKTDNPAAYDGIRRNCRENAVEKYDWNSVLADMTGTEPTNQPRHSPAASPGGFGNGGNRTINGTAAVI